MKFPERQKDYLRDEPVLTIGDSIVHGIKSLTRKRAAMIVIGGAAILGGAGIISSWPPEKPERVQVDPPGPEKPGSELNEYDRVVPKGRFSDEERKKRVITLPNGSVVFKDLCGLYFYKVVEGDNKERIIDKLSQVPEFAYVKDLPDYKLKSWNILDKDIKPGENGHTMWLPIPVPFERRTLTSEEFFKHSNQAIDEMLKDEVYGRSMREILRKIGRRELLVSMMTMAKKESGGEPIGQFVFHRWESGKQAFSFSLYHVLMVDAGLEARTHINKTEGQLYHPKVAGMLFLAFLCEKTGEGKACHPARYLPITDDPERFASMYNGANWRKINSDYATLLVKYHTDASADIAQGSFRHVK